MLAELGATGPEYLISLQSFKEDVVACSQLRKSSRQLWLKVAGNCGC